MKVRLICKPERFDELSKELTDLGIEINQSSHLVLREENQDAFILGYKDEKTTLIKPSELIYAESFGDDIIGHTIEGSYQLNHKLYEFEGLYEDEGFIRIHKSYVVNINHIRHISASFNTKLSLTLKNGEKVIVSRSYYHKFKERIGMK